MLFFCRGRTDKVREVEITTQCPECHGDHLVRDYSRAEIVCEDCGLVLDDMIIDEGPEWRALASEQRENPEAARPPRPRQGPHKGPPPAPRRRGKGPPRPPSSPQTPGSGFCTREWDGPHPAAQK